MAPKPIKSNASTAHSRATEISSAAVSIADVANASKDEVTTLQGNTTASTSIDTDGTAASQAATQLAKFVSLIHSVSSDFESTDQELSQKINQLVNGTYKPS